MRRPSSVSEPDSGSMMTDGSDRLEFRDVDVLGYRGVTLRCRVGTRVVSIPLHCTPGSTMCGRGDRRRLVLMRKVAIALGLA